MLRNSLGFFEHLESLEFLVSVDSRRVVLLAVVRRVCKTRSRLLTRSVLTSYIHVHACARVIRLLNRSLFID